MFRKRFIPKTKEDKDPIAWRSHDVSRIEAFSDAVFAFAVTLLVVSLEVPKTFDELLENMKGFFAFGVSFMLLFQIWYTQNQFFRRFGLQDKRIVTLNAALLFVVLFYVYPLKFLFTMLLFKPGDSSMLVSGPQLVELMVIYGLGFTVIYLLFAWMYWHAIGHDKLQLTASERFHSFSGLYSNVLMAGVGVFSIVLALLLPYKWTWVSGPIYAIIGPAMSVLHSRRGKRHRVLHEVDAQADASR